jgi:hypothetical protein
LILGGTLFQESLSFVLTECPRLIEEVRSLYPQPIFQALEIGIKRLVCILDAPELLFRHPTDLYLR